MVRTNSYDVASYEKLILGMKEEEGEGRGGGIGVGVGSGCNALLLHTL